MLRAEAEAALAVLVGTSATPAFVARNYGTVLLWTWRAARVRHPNGTDPARWC